MSKFSELIDQVADVEHFDLNSVLLRSKVLASRFKNRTFKKWLELEVAGYPDDNVPEYRILRNPPIFGDFAGPCGSAYKNVPLATANLSEKDRTVLETIALRENVGALEALSKPGDGIVKVVWGMPAIARLRERGVHVPGMILNHAETVIGREHLTGALHAIRSRLLDFLLALRDKYPELDENDAAATTVTTDDVEDILKATIYTNCTISGDSYTATQAGAMGPNAVAEGNKLTTNQGNIDFNVLANELSILRAEMKREAIEPAQDVAVGAIAEAEEAAKKNDGAAVWRLLKKAGTWSFDVATKIGTAVAAECVKKSMRM